MKCSKHSILSYSELQLLAHLCCYSTHALTRVCVYRHLCVGEGGKAASPCSCSVLTDKRLQERRRSQKGAA